jgi:hypothetical protein
MLRMEGGMPVALPATSALTGRLRSGGPDRSGRDQGAPSVAES